MRKSSEINRKKRSKKRPCKDRFSEKEIMAKLTAIDKHLSWLNDMLDGTDYAYERTLILADIRRTETARGIWEQELKTLWARGKRK